MTRRIMVGVIGAPHGIKGDVRLKSFTDQPAAIARYGTLRSEDGALALEMLSARPLKDDMIVARLKGVSTREAAAALTGVRLFVDRSALPAPETEEFYHADLIGLRAETEDGRVVGQVAAVVNYGAGDLLEIALSDGASDLVAFTRTFVPRVEVETGRVVLAEGALAEAASDSPASGPEKG